MALLYQQIVWLAPQATNVLALAPSYQQSATMATIVHQVQVQQVEQRPSNRFSVQEVIIVQNSREKRL